MDPQRRKEAQEQAALCHVFGNTLRVLIVWALSDREMSVSAISEAIQASTQNTSQHLRLMKDKGILKSRRAGNAVYYRIAPNGLREKCPLLLQGVTKGSENHIRQGDDTQ
jgi:ArsR family transcriptional regulator